MTNLVPGSQSQANRYNSSSSDSLSLDAEETILGHLLSEQQCSLYDALMYLTTYAKSETKSWRSTESVSGVGFWIGFVAGGAAFLAVGSGPIGLAIGSAVAAIGSGGSWCLKDTAERVGGLRRTEFELHRNHPWIREQLWNLSQSGTSTAEIIAAYDRMIFTMFAEGIPSDRGAIAMTMGVDDGIPSVTPEQPIESQAYQPIAVAPSFMSDGMTTAQSQSAAVTVAPSFGVAKKRNPVDILVAALFAHRAFYGGQRTGKTLLAAAASAEIVKLQPGTKVFYVNLFAFDAAESKAMFAHAHKTVIADIAPLSSAKVVKYIDELIDVLDEFSQTTGALLVLDEAASMGDKFSRHFSALSVVTSELVGYLSSIRDSSKKRRKAVWTIAPGIVASNLSDGMKTLLKGFPPVLVAIPLHQSVSWEGQELVTDTTIANQLKVNYSGANFEAPAMDCDRAVLIDGVWMPMPHLSISAQPHPIEQQPAPTPAPTDARAYTAEAIADTDDYDPEQLPALFQLVAAMALVVGVTDVEKMKALNDVRMADELRKDGQGRLSYDRLTEARKRLERTK